MNNKQLQYMAPVIQQEIDSNSIAGASLLVIHNNEEVYRETFGFADKENKKPIAKDTIFRLYSMTKPVTSVASMILYERGLLDLNAPVSKYLDGFKNQKVYTEQGLVDVTREVTIQDLLNMTSGVVYPDGSYYVGTLMQELYDEVDRKENSGERVDTLTFCNQIGQKPLEFQPGECWRYGASADIMGAVIEVITGKKFSQYLQDEIFTPLGMVDTGFYVPEEKLNRFSLIYEYKDDVKNIVPFDWNFLGLRDYSTPPAFESGGAGLVSTIDDYSKFTSMLVNHGIYNGVRILGKKTIEYISTNQLTDIQAKGYNWPQLQGYGYANLMRTMINKELAKSNGSIGEYGWDGWAGNYFFIDPKENLIMIYMIQKCGGTNPEVTNKLRSIIYSSLE
ncbi:serine hydrolase domain-containing protein [Anaeromicropila herbilytica]|uniref:Serine hydrolase n=1 Tax=Anaeromicropila herbilytica TaxID=2785025 RepID=A0A7R7EJA3_9FIRM|nr:serine hydrolase domain-containing protein [Anaeromicropila herbilytica]BCN29803.1 serine hydrolase [Anaeromicropila herbilytica]